MMEGSLNGVPFGSKKKGIFGDEKSKQKQGGKRRQLDSVKQKAEEDECMYVTFTASDQLRLRTVTWPSFFSSLVLFPRSLVTAHALTDCPRVHTPLFILSVFLEHKDGVIEQSSLSASTAAQHLADQTPDPYSAVPNCP